MGSVNIFAGHLFVNEMKLSWPGVLYEWVALTKSGRESCEQSQHSKALSALSPLTPLRRSLCAEGNPFCWTISYSSRQACCFCIETGLLIREISQSEWCYRVAQKMHFQTFHSTWKLGVGLSIKHSRFYFKLPFAVESLKVCFFGTLYLLYSVSGENWSTDYD